jgi:hypothetical protein
MGTRVTFNINVKCDVNTNERGDCVRFGKIRSKQSVLKQKNKEINIQQARKTFKKDQLTKKIKILLSFYYFIYLVHF